MLSLVAIQLNSLFVNFSQNYGKRYERVRKFRNLNDLIRFRSEKIRRNRFESVSKKKK